MYEKSMHLFIPKHKQIKNCFYYFPIVAIFIDFVGVVLLILQK